MDTQKKIRRIPTPLRERNRVLTFLWYGLFVSYLAFMCTLSRFFENNASHSFLRSVHLTNGFIMSFGFFQAAMGLYGFYKKEPNKLYYSAAALRLCLYLFLPIFLFIESWQLLRDQLLQYVRLALHQNCTNNNIEQVITQIKVLQDGGVDFSSVISKLCSMLGNFAYILMGMSASDYFFIVGFFVVNYQIMFGPSNADIHRYCRRMWNEQYRESIPLPQPC